MTSSSSSSSRSETNFVQQDVFSSVPLLGNPVAVVLPSPSFSSPISDDEQQQARFAKWTNLSETTFLAPPKDKDRADYSLRIWTPFGELPFAGHPTLGSCQVWLDHVWTKTKTETEMGEKDGKDGQGEAQAQTQDRTFASGQPNIITQECGIGLVKIKRDPSNGRLALAAPGFLKFEKGTEEEILGVCQTLGIERDEVLRAQWTDNGPKWFTLLLKSAQAVLSAKVSDTTHLLTPNIGLVGPYLPALPLFQSSSLLPASNQGGLTEEVEYDGTPSSSQLNGAEAGASFEVRAIFKGIEDPVTGSLNAGIAKWLIEEGLAPPSYIASQGKAMGRRGRVYVSADSKDEGGEIWIGGDSSEVIRGRVSF